ncbi:MAG: hypothetical protein ABJ360_25890 [Roseobacter sp.]
MKSVLFDTPAVELMYFSYDVLIALRALRRLRLRHSDILHSFCYLVDRTQVAQGAANGSRKVLSQTFALSVPLRVLRFRRRFCD